MLPHALMEAATGRTRPCPGSVVPPGDVLHAAATSVVASATLPIAQPRRRTASSSFVSLPRFTITILIVNSETAGVAEAGVDQQQELVVRTVI
jgi:hypothetical protein